MIDLTHMMWDFSQEVKGRLREELPPDRSYRKAEVNIARPLARVMRELHNALIEKENLGLPRNLR